MQHKLSGQLPSTIHSVKVKNITVGEHVWRKTRKEYGSIYVGVHVVRVFIRRGETLMKL